MDYVPLWQYLLMTPEQRKLVRGIDASQAEPVPPPKRSDDFKDWVEDQRGEYL